MSCIDGSNDIGSSVCLINISGEYFGSVPVIMFKNKYYIKIVKNNYYCESINNNVLLQEKTGLT